MTSRLFWIALPALIVVNASCSDRTGSAGEPAPASTADLPQSEADLTAAPAKDVPAISARTYVGGSATVKVTGSFEINENIALNLPASLSDGSMTWLQYGVSGSEAPNLLVTISLQEVGLGVARGKSIATAGAEVCEGSMEVTANAITGNYTCPRVTSYDPRNAKLAEVNIEIHFTATS